MGDFKTAIREIADIAVQLWTQTAQPQSTATDTEKEQKLGFEKKARASAMSDKDLFKAVRQYEELGEVVTCGECKYYKPYSWQSNNGECTYSDEHERAVCWIDYCSKGERRENK